MAALLKDNTGVYVTIRERRSGGRSQHITVYRITLEQMAQIIKDGVNAKHPKRKVG